MKTVTRMEIFNFFVSFSERPEILAGVFETLKFREPNLRQEIRRAFSVSQGDV